MSSGPSDDTKHGSSRAWSLTLAALGIVFGDIATSPLYAVKECFSEMYGIIPSPENVLGLLSLIIWTMVSLVLVKYIMYVMRADNQGEGGILSLMTLGMDRTKKKQNFWLIMVGLFGAALLYGDGAVTPAISVISAVEGLSLISPRFSPFVIPVTIVILVGLFSLQRFGTQKIGRVFGPIVLTYLLTLALLGFFKIIETPEIFFSFNPYYAVRFFIENGAASFWVLGSVFLVATGCEAIYADMGHFGRIPIRRAWLYLVFPCLLINYLGQGALLIQDPSLANNPFYNLAPTWAMIPLVIIATLATIVASQALISGVFSLTSQSILMGYWPRLRIVHTSHSEKGQIYVPQMNWFLMIACIWLVLEFKSSSALAHAYGLAVSLTMFMTTLLFVHLVVNRWRWSRFYALPLGVIFLGLDTVFVSANASKFLSGGWAPIAMAVVVFTLMTTWKRGRRILAARMREKTVPLKGFIESLSLEKYHRVPGCAVFMSSDSERAPLPLVRNTEVNHSLYEHILLLSIMTSKESRVMPKDRIQMANLGQGIYRVTAWYGFMESPSIQSVFEALQDTELKLDLDSCIFFLGRETLLASDRFGGMVAWREILFAFLSRNAQRATQFYNIPPDQVVEIGTQVEL